MKYVQLKDTISLGTLAPLLGYDEHLDILVENGWMKSTKHANINRGFKYVTISCTDVNSYHNFDVKGNRSFLVSTIPVPSEQSLFSTVTNFIGINSEAPMSNGTFNRLEFDVSTNVGNIVDIEIVIDAHVTQ